VRRLLLLALGAGAIAGGAAGPARGGSECEGLIVCIRVVGPWVQVPAGEAATYYRLQCPGRGQTIGGLDADRSGRVELSFLGALGGPISPGVTTGRAAVFVGRPARGTAAFRPLLGCIPASGGGGRSRTVSDPPRSPTAAAPAPRPAEPVLRRVKTVLLDGDATERVSHGCREGERLLSFSQAIAFRARRAPTAATLASVRAASRRAGRRVIVTVRSRDVPAGLKVEVQVHALCGKMIR
jgi:hypothetical protein